MFPTLHEVVLLESGLLFGDVNSPSLISTASGCSVRTNRPYMYMYMYINAMLGLTGEKDSLEYVAMVVLGST